MKYLKIIKCDDPLMWYVNKVEETVPYLGEDLEEEIYWSREDSGKKNIVKMEDAITLQEIN